MISTPTLLVLGAGASMPYGYPSGDQLYTEIMEMSRSSGGVQDLTSAGFKPQFIEKFCTDLRHNQQYSIDRFLNQRREYSDIGKFSIALRLVRCEVPEGMERVGLETGHWYRYLWNRLSSGNTWEAFEKNALRIITFNYDRSLEHYLARALAALEPERSYADAVAHVQKIPIRHMYGQLGKLTGDTEAVIKYLNGARPYETHAEKFVVDLAADGIQTIHERDLDTDLGGAIREDMTWAHRVCFLGFGYDEDNLKRLELDALMSRVTSAGSGLSIMGTSLGILGREYDAIRGAFNHLQNPSVFAPMDSEVFLRTNGVLLR